MPLYDYGCEDCGTELEVRHPLGKKPDLKCEVCGEPLERLILTASPARLDDTFPGERQKVVDARLKRQEGRLQKMVAEGKLGDDDVDRMAEIRDKYAKDSPYMMDPTKDGKQDPNPEEPSAGHFDDQLEM